MGIPFHLERLFPVGIRALSPGEFSPLYRDRSKAEAADFVKFPLKPPRTSWLEAWAIKRRGGPMTCTVCGEFTRFAIKGENLREDCACVSCGATNRNRQIAYVLCSALSKQLRTSIHSLADFRQSCKDLTIYNTEASGAVHSQLRGLSEYQCSEYFGLTHRSGEMVNGVMHQDLMQLSLKDNSIDVVLSSDVFEHIPNPYRAHEEIRRVLRPGGRHVFTAPFHMEGFLDETRATLDETGAPVFLAPPIFHDDPLSSQGALVYTIFGLEMLIRLNRIGFVTNLYHLSAPWLGILGPNAVVFEASKTQCSSK